jgi:hypothetical protein
MPTRSSRPSPKTARPSRASQTSSASAGATGTGAGGTPGGRPPAAAADPFDFDAWCRGHLSERVVVRRPTRGESARPLRAQDLAVEHALLEVHFADGSTLFTDPRSYVQAYAVSTAKRGADGAAADRIELPFDLVRESTALQRSGGTGSAAIDRYAITELTDPTSLDRLFEAGESLRRAVAGWFGLDPTPSAALPLAAKLCAAYEASALDRAVGDAGGALLAWDRDRWVSVTDGRAVDPGDRPVLLFLHGTASSTAGSFAPLWAPGRDGKVPADFDRLTRSHRLLAWEHRTLTHSPIDNVIELVETLLRVLPQTCTIDVVSHSRGGLVGELFNLRSADALGSAREAFESPFAAAEHPDAPRIGRLFDLLGRAGESWRAGSFVRVACPARGTLLADGRTDLFLSLLLRTVGLAARGIAQVFYDRLAALVKSLVAARADARTVPGLEAMIPGSPLTRALAACEARPTDRLRVIAGDTAARGLSGVFTLIADVFYGWHDHDYVVHTRSMFGGLRRVAQAPRSLRWEHSSVSHFAYFGDDSASRTGLMTALAGRDDGFAPMAEDEQRTRTGQRGPLQALKADPLSRRTFEDWQKQARSAPQARKPVLVVLAGIMGSELKRTDAAVGSPVWLSLRSMLGGQLAELDLDAEDRLHASGLLAVSYERLLERAQPRFNTVSIPYDWRQPIAASGVVLRERLAAVLSTLDDATLPVHLIVHSMGGLVARHALFFDAEGQALWQTLTRRGGRLLMLGTPNRGSYAPAQLLLRQHSMAQLLGLFATRVSGRDISNFGAGFPGLLQMLPQDDDATFGDLFDDKSWDAVRKADARTILPQPPVLREAREYVRSAAFQRSFDALRADRRALYVAGVGPTPLAMRPRANPWREVTGVGDPVFDSSIEFVGAQEGDGTVPWTSTLDPERTWYAPCEHGTLADHTASFEAYFDLIEEGRTKRLVREAPRQRSGEPVVVPSPPQPALLPESDDELAAYALQLEGDAPSSLPPPEPIAVRVVHGGLDYARYPLMVGHYQNEPPTGAARRVDEKLGGQLQCVLDLKLFVGASRTAHYLRPNNHSTDEPSYPGAVVLGLGSIGELTPGNLAETVARGVLRYAFEHIHRDPYAPKQDESVDLRLSSVLLGTQIQAVNTRDSLAGLLQGVWQAAQLVPRIGSLSRPVRIRELEIIEIDEHTALDAAYELQRLLARGDWRERFRWDSGVLETREGQMSGYRPRGASSTWQRLVVRQNDLGGLNFSLIGAQARVEATQVDSDVASLRRFIDRVSDDQSDAADRIASAIDPRLGGVLYQLLLPHELKGRLGNLDNTVLVLDDETACYPWELLSQPPEGGSGSETSRPFAVHAGLVRQRVTSEFRQLPQRHTGFNALIVGSPTTDGWRDAQGQPLRFSDLPGARAEARLVQELLAGDHRNWQVAPLIGEAPTAAGTAAKGRVGFEQVRVALLEKPYRLLHLCGHGVVDQWIRQGGDARALRKSGMVLSDQELLGAVDVQQMSTTPEFVFINCCYSGREGTAVTGGPAATMRQRAALASSLALKFIDMGARAVIAAGWQVDDDAALLFAQCFYERLLGGLAFGDAALAARVEVHARHGHRTNTWGAYQCYGDPAWSLADVGGDSGGGGETSRLRDAELSLSPGELASRIAQVPASAGDKPAATTRRQLDAVVGKLRGDPQRRDWLRDSRVRASLGLAYREIGEHKTAAGYLQLGARMAYSEVKLGQLDALVNSMSRVGEPGASVAAAKMLELINGIGADPEASWPLSSLRDPEPSALSERQCLLGSLHLRTACRLLEAPDPGDGDPKEELRSAAKAFAGGFEAKLAAKDALERRSYALSNALLGAALLQMLYAAEDPESARGVAVAVLMPEAGTGASPDADEVAQRWLRHAEEHLDQLQGDEHRVTFWQHATAIDLRTARGLFAHVLNRADYTRETVAVDVQKVRRQIERVMTLWPTPVQSESMQHRFRLIGQVVARCRRRTDADPHEQALLTEIADIAREGLERLQLGLRAIG